MGDTVEVVPAPNGFFDGNAGSQPFPGNAMASSTKLDSQLGVAYAERVKRYDQELDAGHRRRFGAIPPTDRYPSTDVRLPGGTLRVVYNGDLDRQLLQAYTLHGWAAITAIEESIKRADADPLRANLHPWQVIQGFFTFTRNRLLVQIRGALLEIERHAADQVVAQLNETTNLVTNALLQLRLETTTIGPQGREEMVPSPSWDTPSTQKRAFYRVGNRALACALYPVVSRAVLALDDIRNLQAKVQGLDEAIQRYGENNPLEQSRHDLAVAQLQLHSISADLEDLLEDVGRVLPLAVLVLPLLTTPFKQALMEHRLGEVLGPLRDEPERIVRGINAGNGWLAKEIPGWDTVTPLDKLSLIDGMIGGRRSLEEAVVALALENAASEPAYLPILSEKALDRLTMDGGPVAPDSLAFVVWAHYKAELIEAVERERSGDEKVAQVVEAMTKVAAFLSLVFLITPAGRIARIVQGALGVGLLAYQAFSVVHTLSLLDRNIDLALSEADKADMQTLSRLSELHSMRAEYFDQIAGTALLELGLIVSAGAFPELKLLLHWRAYYFDLQTLLEG